jgi:hypothetical protein
MEAEPESNALQVFVTDKVFFLSVIIAVLDVAVVRLD